MTDWFGRIQKIVAENAQALSASVMHVAPDSRVGLHRLPTLPGERRETLLGFEVRESAVLPDYAVVFTDRAGNIQRVFDLRSEEERAASKQGTAPSQGTKT